MDSLVPIFLIVLICVFRGSYQGPHRVYRTIRISSRLNYTPKKGISFFVSVEENLRLSF